MDSDTAQAPPPAESPEERAKRNAEVERIIRQREAFIAREQKRKEDRIVAQKKVEKFQSTAALEAVAEVERKHEAFEEWRAEKKEQKRLRELERLAREKELQRQLKLKQEAAEKAAETAEYMEQVHRSAMQKRLAAERKHNEHEEEVEIKRADDHFFAAKQSADMHLQSEMTRLEYEHQRNIRTSKETADIARRQLVARLETRKRDVQKRRTEAETKAKSLPEGQRRQAADKARADEQSNLRAIESERRAEESSIEAQQRQRDVLIRSQFEQQIAGAKRACEQAKQNAEHVHKQEIALAAQRRADADRQAAIRAGQPRQ